MYRYLVRLKSLPEPDFLEFTLGENSIALLTDDGSPITTKLAESLQAKGWKVVVLSYLHGLVKQQSPLPEGINRVLLKDLSEDHLQQQLTVINTTYGKVAAFIHLNPIIRDENHQTICYAETEKATVKQVFFLAKHLKDYLQKNELEKRTSFLTVAHLDGQFGLGLQRNFGAIGGGLFGLTKTLNLEWEAVFCRAIDLSPEFDTNQSVNCILAELHDPNCLISEVGYSKQGRATLVCEKPVDC